MASLRVPLATISSVLAVTVLGTATAHAEALAVIGSSAISVNGVTDGWKFCAGGTIDPSNQVAGQWTLLIGGVRDGAPFTLTPWSSAAGSVFHCETVYRDGTTTGSISVDFGYLGVGSYVVAHSVAGAAWGPVIGNQPYGVDPTP